MSFSSIFIIPKIRLECLKKSEMSDYEILKTLLHFFKSCGYCDPCPGWRLHVPVVVY